MSNFKVLPNLVSSKFLTDATAPWDNTEPVPYVGTKLDYREWQVNQNTHYSFFTLWEGVNSSVRIGQSNEPWRTHGIVVDYDYAPSQDDMRLFEKRIVSGGAAAPFRPWAWNHTFSGGVRLIWLFEEPVLYTDKELWNAFFETARKELGWNSLLPCADESAMKNPSQLWCTGDRWRKLQGTVPKGVTADWAIRASKRVNWVDVGAASVPLDVVEKKLTEKYGNGFWPAAFEEGSRGTRFWENGDASSVILREGGFQCFTGDKGFIPWADERLLGLGFVNQFRTELRGNATNSFYFDGSKYLTKSTNGAWVKINQDTIKRRLKIDYGLKTKPGKGEAHSELELVLNDIEKHRMVCGTISVAGARGETINLSTGEYLNVCTTRLVRPSAEKKEWGQDFPWIASWFDKFCQEKEARDHLLAWVAHVYRTLYHGTDERFQNILLVGAPGSGKTLFSRAILGDLLGGACDAESYFTGASVFNAHMAHSLVWSLDDPSTGGDRKQLLKLTERLKSMSANPTMAYNEAYGSKLEIPFKGVVVMSINDDVDSLHSLPAITASIKDKLNVYRISSHKPDLSSDRGANNRMITSELPAFASYLLHTHENAVNIKPHSRFGIDVYHDGGILESTQENTYQSLVEGLVVDWINARALNPENKEIRATTTEILNDILEGPGTKGAGRGLGIRSLGLTLAKLAEDQEWIEKKSIKTPAGPRKAYVIDLDAFRVAAT